MRKLLCLAIALITCLPLIAEDEATRARKAVEKTTLDQASTHPFHLKATYAPSFERDKASNRAGDIEIWWQSPTRWRRELRSPEFHQIQIVDGAHIWQKNEGDYLPEWLRVIAVALIRPIPLPMDVLDQRLRSAKVRNLGLQVNLEWDAIPGDPASNGAGHIAIPANGPLLFYTGGVGFSGYYKDFQDFHGRSVARVISTGRVEVTAKIDLLEDLNPEPADFFDASAPNSDPIINTIQLDEATLGKSMLTFPPIVWPPIADGPLEGVVWTEIVLDRTGKIREIERPIADNAGINDTAGQAFRALKFHPILREGIPVQAAGRISTHFKTTRPVGMENFMSARAYFDNGRKASFLAAGATKPYTLHAEFQSATTHGIDNGRYVDTWISPTQWKREAWIGNSHLARAQVGDKHYVLSEGPDAGILRFVMLALEPLPAPDTMTESDWRIRRDPVDNVQAIRVFRGPEGPKGELDATNSQGYWFDESGHLVKTFTNGLEIRPETTSLYDGVQSEKRVDVLKDHKLAMWIAVQDIASADPALVKSFPIKGHEWQRAFTAEVR